MKQSANSAIIPHRLVASIGMVALILLWVAGWFSGINPFKDMQLSILVLSITAGVFLAWNLVASVIASGFFHAASTYHTTSFNVYRVASLRLVIFGVLFLFPVPLMAIILGTGTLGRVYSLVITGLSVIAIIFNRARLTLIEKRMNEMEESSMPFLVPIEEMDQLGEKG